MASNLIIANIEAKMKIQREGDFGKNALSIAKLSERMRGKMILMMQELNKLAS